jgi:hypothetical protein
VDVHPAPRKASPQIVDVVLAQEIETAKYEIDALAIVVALLRLG